MSDKIWQLMLALVLVLLGAGAPLRAEPTAIVDTQFVSQARERGAILWDVRGEEDYRRGHIPGAVNMDEVLGELRESNSEDYLPVEQLEQRLGATGIDLAREIVVYASKGSPAAYFAQVTLRYLGAANVRVYHGGIDDWKQAGQSLSTEPETLPAVAVKARLNPDLLISTDEVIARLNRPDTQIVDARSPREYHGEDIRALRGGHIPGALNIPYEANWVDPDTPRKLQRKQVGNKDGMNLKSAAELRRLYAAFDPDKETIVYCQSGNRAAETFVVLQELGFRNVKLYDSFWLAYGNRFDAPAESVSYFNVGRVNGLLNGLQSQIDALEAEIERLKAGGVKR